MNKQEILDKVNEIKEGKINSKIEKENDQEYFSDCLQAAVCPECGSDLSYLAADRIITYFRCTGCNLVYRRMEGING